MFTTIKARFHDIKTINRLCTSAEQFARAAGRIKPGSEHFVLAALDLSDLSAQRAFARLGITSVAFSAAINAQFLDALASIGISVNPEVSAGNLSSYCGEAPPALYEAEPSGQLLMQRIAALAKSRVGRPILSADVLLAVSQEEFTIASRAFKRLSITAQQLATAANEAISATQKHASDA